MELQYKVEFSNNKYVQSKRSIQNDATKLLKS